MRKFVENPLSLHDSPQRTSGLRGWNRATFGHVAKWGTWLLLAGLLAGCSSALQSTGVPLAPAGGCLQAAAAAAPEVLRPAVQGVGRFDLPHLPGRVIVYQEGMRLQSAVQPELERLEARPLQPVGKRGWQLYTVRPGAELEAARALLRGGARYVQPEYLYRPSGLAVPPNSPDYPLNQRPIFAQLNLEEAWRQLTPGCARPVVAVADTGFYTERSDLRPNLTPSASWLDLVGDDLAAPQPVQGRVTPGDWAGRNHGTAVAGVIAAVTDRGWGLAGAAYNLAQVLPLKVFDAHGQASTLQIAQAVEYALGATTIGGQTFVNPYPAQVLNLSLALAAPQGQGFHDPYLEAVLEQATQKGLVVVAASGNEGADSIDYPASSPWVIAVGATDMARSRAVWSQGAASNYGQGLAFMAPGSEITTLSGRQEGEYANGFGTSFAAPFISSVVALYLYQQNALGKPQPAAQRLAEVRRCLRSAAQHGPDGWEPQTGYGLVDAAQVVNPANAWCF
ncbi:MAG: S8 family serine peptidase [Meiothermus silvanus]|nr:S8 family serine peptidase [Allomeiothermus silvanus]